MRRTAGFLFVLLVGLASVAHGAGAFHLRDGDRVLFYGDSITERGLYTAIVETYAVTRYPGLDLTFVNAGWAGDTVRGGTGGSLDTRLARDVLPHGPTVMTIMLGMNDRSGAEGMNDRQFFSGYENLISSMRARLPAVRITAVIPSPYDDVTRPPAPYGSGNAVLARFGRWIESYATEAGLGLADMNAPLVQVLARANEVDPERARGIIPDRMHPGMAGALIMAEQLLKAWNARPLVAAATIDTSGRVPEAVSIGHSRVSELSRKGDGISWTQLDDALPLPFAAWERTEHDGPSVSLVIRCSDVTAVLNEQPLWVTGLKELGYALRIDGVAVGVFTSAELAEGVNLAVLDTPMAMQAGRVHELTLAHQAIQRARWRQVQVRLATYDLPQKKAAIEALDALEMVLVQQQREAARPMPRRFELIPNP